MSDVTYLALALLFFGLSWGFVTLAGRLQPGGSEK
jgi:hypothetical protein